MSVTVHPRPSIDSALAPADTRSGQPWWLQPIAVVVGLTAFGIYAIWASLQNAGFADPYQSPFYSPHVPFGGMWAPFYVLWVPLGFRASCYYYRKAYYRSFFWDPPSCARPESRLRRHYFGERIFPFILNNAHRFFLYLSIIVIIVLWIDALRAFDFSGRFGIGLGTFFLVVNAVLLSLYTFSCHSFRHWIGGSACISCEFAGSARHRLWRGISTINTSHGLFAWLSLTSLLVSDIYIRLLLFNVFADPRWVF